MRQVIVSINLSLDGCLSGPEGDLDWHICKWTEDMGRTLCRQLAAADTILLGRVTYCAMEAYWKANAGNLSGSREDLAFADMMYHHRKLVVSASLRQTSWYNSGIISGSIEHEVRRLKEREGRDVIIYGSARLVHVLLTAGLIDGFRFWVHPVVLGRGVPLFGDAGRMMALTRTDTEVFNSGVVLLSYRNAGAPDDPPAPAAYQSSSISVSSKRGHIRSDGFRWL